MSNEFDELLQALLNDEAGDVTPQSRTEEILLSAIDNYGVGSLPKPSSRLEAYLMALVGRMINASKNPDWDQNDPSAVDYVKGRPCYHDTRTVSLINVDVMESGEKLPPIVYEIGKTYAIEVDGVRYELECVVALAEFANKYRLGFGIEDGVREVIYRHEPFVMLSDLYDLSYIQSGVELELSFLHVGSIFQYPANVKILMENDIIHKLDPKFMPENIPLYITIDFGQEPPVLNMTVDEYFEYLDAGKPVYLSNTGGPIVNATDENGSTVLTSSMVAMYEPGFPVMYTMVFDADGVLINGFETLLFDEST